MHSCTCQICIIYVIFIDNALMRKVCEFQRLIFFDTLTFFGLFSQFPGLPHFTTLLSFQRVFGYRQIESLSLMLQSFFMYVGPFINWSKGYTMYMNWIEIGRGDICFLLGRVQFKKSLYSKHWLNYKTPGQCLTSQQMQLSL